MHLVDRAQKYLKLHRYYAIGIATATLILLLLAFPFRFLVVPALVNNQPIFFWQYAAKLHQQAGSQVLQQLINETLIEQEISKQGITITQSEIDQELANLEAQMTNSGGLDALLTFQGITKPELIRQIKLNLGLEKLIKGTITITDAEVNQELEDNTNLYQGLSEVDSATTAAENLRQSKLRQAFTDWFEQLRAQAKISNFLNRE
ncbi:MAG: SurA N-terminal domain-containing protein [Candidatus Chisholmbacteria bacterium]|nr:SurA N-terminal domain-containing protein [Candidatus Chisholmbacteria bacterium]